MAARKRSNANTSETKQPKDDLEQALDAIDEVNAENAADAKAEEDSLTLFVKNHSPNMIFEPASSTRLEALAVTQIDCINALEKRTVLSNIAQLGGRFNHLEVVQHDH